MERCIRLARCKRYPMRDADLQADTETDAFDGSGEGRPVGSKSVEKKAVWVAKTDEHLRERVDDTPCEVDYGSVRTDIDAGTAGLGYCPEWYWDAAKTGHAESVPPAGPDYNRRKMIEDGSGA